MSAKPQPGAHPVSDDDLLANAIPIEPEEPEDELAPIDLERADDRPDDDHGASKIRMFDNKQRHTHEDHWKRKPNVTGQGAIHVKTFVSKLRLDAIEHMDEQVNEWLDNHPEYEVKFVTTSIGPLVGKLTEAALFVNVWV